MTDNWFSADDTMEEAWRKYHRANPDVLASWREQNGWWPMGHPNDVGMPLTGPTGDPLGAVEWS